jgi:hypothetical protein
MKLKIFYSQTEKLKKFDMNFSINAVDSSNFVFFPLKYQGNTFLSFLSL